VVFLSYFIKQCCSFVHPKVLTTANYTVGEEYNRF
jgi:hypothetical protein